MALRNKPASVLPVMVGTSGHVDHGKSALVKLLTGCEMDRHPEARARGLTIDLGFAPCRLPGNRLVGIVDVPGHEDFIRNMVAGASTMDVLMLVVAADDGVMPQTREHMLIVRLLRTPRVMVVISKIDLVDSEMRELVLDDVRSFLRENGFADAPVVMASNVTLEGIDRVRQTLVSLVQSVERDPDERALRMHVERVFSVKGYGTVVTGTPLSGSLAVGEQVELLPVGTRHDLRTVQTYKLDARAAVAGACAAMNLRDLDARVVSRGMTVAAPGVYAPTSGFLCHLANAHPALVLKRRARVKFHAGTGAVNASVKLLDAQCLRPGAAGFAHLRLERPLVLAAGDRCVLRCLSPVTTLGGGVVLSVRDHRLKRSDPFLLPRLQAALAAVGAGDLLMAELYASPVPVLTRGEALRFTQCHAAVAARRLERAVAAGELVDLGGDGLLVKARGEELAAWFTRKLRHYHRQHPYQWGMDPAHACRELGLAPGAGRRLARELTQDDGVRMQHGRLALEDFAPRLSGQQIKWREAMLEHVRRAGVKAPARGDLARELGIPAKDVRLLARLLEDEGLVAAVGNSLVDAALIRECERKILDVFRTKPMIEVSDFRRVTGVSRNLAVALLEEFDRRGLTRRLPQGRVLVAGKAVARESTS